MLAYSITLLFLEPDTRYKKYLFYVFYIQSEEDNEELQSFPVYHHIDVAAINLTMIDTETTVVKIVIVQSLGLASIFNNNFTI